MLFPLGIVGFGIVVCFISSFIATNCTTLDEGYTLEMKIGAEEKKLGPNALYDIEGILRK